MTALILHGGAGARRERNYDAEVVHMREVVEAMRARLDAGDLGIAALHAQALERAGDLCSAIHGAITGHGVLQLPQAPRDAARFDKIARQPIWNDDDMAVLDEGAASAVAGEATGQGGLLMKGAFALRPAAETSPSPPVY